MHYPSEFNYLRNHYPCKHVVCPILCSLRVVVIILVCLSLRVVVIIIVCLSLKVVVIILIVVANLMCLS